MQVANCVMYWQHVQADCLRTESSRMFHLTLCALALLDEIGMQIRTVTVALTGRYQKLTATFLAHHICVVFVVRLCK